jgi:hypothetical protein
MKHIILTIALAACIFTANFASASASLFGNTLTKFGTYQLTPASAIESTDNVNYKTWELKYSGSHEKYQIILIPGSNGKHSFKIVGKNMELVYTIEADNFGTTYIEPVSKVVNGKATDVKELKAQAFKTPVMKSAEYLDIVACLAPRLMN